MTEQGPKKAPKRYVRLSPKTLKHSEG
jgi:hypothetical protein